MRITHLPMAILAFFGLGLCGCQNPTLVVSRPEVFTRERLVNRRLHEVQFLEKKLDAPFEQGIQGARDVREFSGLIAQVRGTFDPMAGAASMLNIANLQRQAETAQLQHAVNVTLLQQQLEALRKNPATQPATQPGNDIPAPANAQAALTQPSTAGMPNFSAFKDRPPLPTPADVVTSQAKTTQVEALRDEVAYRNSVQAMLREQELDDTHDLKGYTLYTLKFDITTMPGDGTNKFGQVKVLLPNEMDAPKDNVVGLYYQWRDRVRRDVMAEAINLQRTYINPAARTSATQLARLADRISLSERMVRFHLNKTKGRPGTWEPRSEIYNSFHRLPAGPAAASPESATVLKKLLCELAQAKYEALNEPGKELVTFGEPQPGTGPLADFYVPSVEPFGSDEGVADDAQGSGGSSDSVEEGLRRKLTGSDRGRIIHFYRALKQLKSPPYVYAVEPKEYAQNISDVAAAERLRNLVLSLQAIIPQAGATVAGNLNQLDQSLAKIHAILRKPLVVGYANGEREFGWIIGPHFAIGKHGKVEYVHSPVQQSVQVTLAVPAWAEKLTLSGARSWEGQKRSDELWPDADGGALDVTLPADPTALTSALLAQIADADSEWRVPEAYPRDVTPTPLFTEAGYRQSLLIRGTDLWRNPQVFIGDQRATGVEVLADMRGLLATFDRLTMPPVLDSRSATLDVTIVTSAGATVLPAAVTLVSKGSGAGPAKASLVETFAVAGGNLHVQVDPATFPQNVVSLGLRARLAGQVVPFTDLKAPFLLNDKRSVLTFALPDNLAPDLYEADVRIKTAIDQDEVSLPFAGRKTFACYAKENKPAATLTKSSVTFDQKDVPTGAISLTFPPERATNGAVLFDEAFPGLRDAIKTGDAKLALRKDDLNDKPIQVPLQQALAGATVAPADLLRSGAVPEARSATANDVTNEYKVLKINYSGNVMDPIDVAGGSITVVRKKP